MEQLHEDERTFLEALSELSYANPFEPQRIDLERTALGDEYQPEPLDSWSRRVTGRGIERENVLRINTRAIELLERLRERQANGRPVAARDAPLYDDLVTYVLYYRHVRGLPASLLDPAANDTKLKLVWNAFRNDREHYLAPLKKTDRAKLVDSAHLFALLHQVRRAFVGIYDCLIGESGPATRLRAAVWQSVFTHDLRRYRRTLYRQMGGFATLITGPSGAGKELVARAIGDAQYRPFDAASGEFAGGGDAFTPLNLAALSPTLIESELFGHRKGAFTGAGADRVGWLERCPPHGAVFLDEIGELDTAIQVKLLRVAQTRDYSRLGESEPRRFHGKLLAATNRNLAEEIRAGRFREDLYYRLCSDQVVVPSLAEQLADRPAALGGLVRFLAGKVLGANAEDESAGCGPEAETLAAEVQAFIAAGLPRGYTWPGNIRELEQCVRSVLLRRHYTPPAPVGAEEPRLEWLAGAESGSLTADELITAYCRHVHARAGGYEPAARVLGLDRRTVKSRVVGAS